MLMQLSDLVAKYDMSVKGVLHVGAHLAEEALVYEQLHMHDVWWVEANEKVLHQIELNLKELPAQHLIHALVYEEDDVELSFNVTNYDGMSSSILDFGTHPQFSPDTVFVDQVTLTTSTIDTLVDRHDVRANFLNMDIQGAELFALKGAHKFLEGVDYIMSEVNQAQVYIGCAQVEQLDAFLADFVRVETHWVPGQGWGDGFWVRKGLL